MHGSQPEDPAFAFFRDGRYAEAERLCREILARDPDRAPALHLLGLVLARTGRREEGLGLLDRSIEGAAPDPRLLCNRALVLAEAGRLDQALGDLRRAVQLAPRLYEALCQLGSVLRSLGRLDEAAAAFRRAAAAEPRRPEAHVGLGNVLRARGEPEAARASYEGALALDPGNASALYNFGNLLLDFGDLAGAERAFRRALAREPANAMAWNNLGTTLRRGERLEEAHACFERGVALDPANAEALNNLGLALQSLERFDEALQRYDEALAHRPGFVEVLLNRGNALLDRGDLAAAEALYERAIRLQPGSAEAYNNAANAALERGDLEEASRRYRRAAELRPDFADPRFSLGQLALRSLDFAAGWEANELRFDTSPPVAMRRRLPVPLLAANDLAGVKRLAIWPEQGVGDQVLYSTLLPELVERGIEAVVEIDRRLVGLYRRRLPGIAFHAPGEAGAEFAGCDHHLPIGSLPRLLRRSAESFRAQPGRLLSADPERIAKVRAELGAGSWIGISWRSFQKGGRRYIAGRKSIPLESFGALLGDGARFLDLQYGEVAAERAAFQARHPGALRALDGLDAFNDLEGLFAAIAACDLVVTASNVTAHFAGALGKRTLLVYLAGQPPFPYWVPGPDGRSLWYPSVEVVSDPAWLRWDEAFAALAARLHAGR